MISYENKTAKMNDCKIVELKIKMKDKKMIINFNKKKSLKLILQ